MSVDSSVSQNVRKGVLFYLGDEFTLQFDQTFIRTHREEFVMMVELVRRLKQKKFDDRKNAWNIAVADDAIRCLQQFVGWGISATKVAREKLSAELVKLAAVDAVFQASTEEIVELDIPGAPELNAAMKNYQKAGVRFMATTERSYNGDEMGLGKSLQILATFELKQAFPALIVCPVKLKQNWIKESRKWLPHRSASPLANVKADITVLGYNEIHDYVNYKLASPKASERNEAKRNPKRWFFPDFVRPRGVALDEGHWIKRAKESRRGMAAVAVAKTCEPQIRIVASGTPIENGRPEELIAPLKFLGQLEAMGGWHNFVTRYCGATETKFGMDTKGATNTKELHEKLSKICFIRRLKKDVLKELPAKIQSIYDVELSNVAEYRRIEADVMGYLMDKRGRLATKDEADASALVKLGLLRSACGIGKVPWIIDWVDEFLESGQKFVLYANSREVQAQLVKGLAKWNPAVVLGGCLDVQAQQDKFMTNESCRLFIGSVKAAGFGLTLTVASHVGLAELDWTDSKHQQVFDRVHRIGQHDCVNCYYFLAPGTIDDDMWAIVSKKARINASAVDGESEAKASVLASVMRKYQTRAA